MNIKKILVFGGIGLILAGGGGYAALHFLKKGGNQSEEASSGENAEGGETTQTEAKTEAPKTEDYASREEEETGLVAIVQDHTINLPDTRSGYLRCKISIIVRDEELAKQMASASPTPENVESKAIVRELLSMLSAEEIRETETQESLKMDIVDRLNERFKPTKPPADKKAPPRPQKPIKDAFITDWAVQL